ncbi:RimK family alpha-L-glutamate ligase [Novosphingobium sp. AP12]|uniref:ATP-grasp domain-containing protein n=1 Tax=Novosphingobium sp. AP12 TaxID=1144305 RepID=UPI000271E266|nr:RimK family alpha-L-glutamate ligase [Novosphingobium sp. AP12]EJL29272.1 alpha-L-glutamate ligase, RimK family [Novosphingobium sp. AP12]
MSVTYRGLIALRGWILFQHELDPAIPEVPEVFRFQEAAGALGIELHVFQPHRFEMVVGTGSDWAMKYQGVPVERPDFVICRTGAETDYFTLALLRHIERRGVRLVNGPETIETVSDKLHTLQTLNRAGLPIPRTILGTFPIDVDLVERELGFPVIVKTLKGTRGAGVLKCEDRSQFEDLAGLLESAEAKADFILQHYVRASHGRDVRVLVVGGRVVAAMERRSLTGGFKSNVSLGGVGVAYNPPQEMAELAVQAADVLELDITGIDILFDEDGYRICEANSAPGFQGLERATGMDVPTSILEWVVATQDAVRERAPLPAESTALADMVFGGRSGLRSLTDRNTEFRRFASAVGLRMIAAGIGALVQASFPPVLVDRRSPTGVGLRSLFEGRMASELADLDDRAQERTLLVVLTVALWAAVLPWLAGAEAIVGGVLSILALSFPVLFLLTAPAGRFGKVRRRKGGGA